MNDDYYPTRPGSWLINVLEVVMRRYGITQLTISQDELLALTSHSRRDEDQTFVDMTVDEPTRSVSFTIRPVIEDLEKALASQLMGGPITRLHGDNIRCAVGILGAMARLRQTRFEVTMADYQWLSEQIGSHGAVCVHTETDASDEVSHIAIHLTGDAGNLSDRPLLERIMESFKPRTGRITPEHLMFAAATEGTKGN